MTDKSQFRLPPREGVPESMRVQFEAFFKSQMGSLLSEMQSEASPDDALFRDELANSPLEVKESPQRGRGLYATRDIRAGETLLKTQPLVSVLSKPRLYEPPAGEKMQLECNGCYQHKPVQRCSGCKGMYYCSAACQQGDWPSHKTECKALKRIRELWVQSYPEKAKNGLDNSWLQAEGARALGQLCWKRREYRNTHGRDPPYWAKVAKMTSAGPPDMDTQQMEAHLMYYLDAAETPRDPTKLELVDMRRYGFSQDDVRALVRSFVLNSFTLSSFDLKPIGVAMSPLMALFNHSCVPNASIVFPNGGKDMHAVANKDIGAGEEVLTTYIDISDDRVTRRAELKERYGFECDCPRCDSDEVDCRWCLKHPGCEQHPPVGAMPDLTRDSTSAQVECIGCGGSWTANPNAIRELVNEGFAICQADDESALTPADFERVSALIDKLEFLMPVSSRPFLRLCTIAKTLLVPPAQPKALELMDNAVAGAKAAYTRNHPSVAILRAEAANLTAQVGFQEIEERGDLLPPVPPAKVKAFLRELLDAADHCDLAFGRGGRIADHLRGFVATLEAETQAYAREQGAPVGELDI